MSGTSGGLYRHCHLPLRTSTVPNRSLHLMQVSRESCCRRDIFTQVLYNPFFLTVSNIPSCVKSCPSPSSCLSFTATLNAGKVYASPSCHDLESDPFRNDARQIDGKKLTVSVWTLSSGQIDFIPVLTQSSVVVEHIRWPSFGNLAALNLAVNSLKRVLQPSKMGCWTVVPYKAMFHKRHLLSEWWRSSRLGEQTSEKVLYQSDQSGKAVCPDPGHLPFLTLLQLWQSKGEFPGTGICRM